MIFIGLFLFIAFVVMALNVYNHSNLAYIEDYLKENNCQEYTYSKGSYKAFCDNYFIEIKNSFIVNIDENSKIFKYEDVNSLQINQQKLIINNYQITFIDEKELDRFYKKLSNKINK
jgi:hypothetical protein